MNGFEPLDWAVVLGLLVATTLVGGRLAGKQEGARDFFLGGRRLPWWAVAASIVATEISAVTFVGLPAMVFSKGGDLTYLQIGLFGSLIARLFVGFVLVPAYFRHEIYSPYDYLGRRLGSGARSVATAVFSLGGVLAQSARVYLTALVLSVLLNSELNALHERTGIDPLVASVCAVGVVAVLWTWMGGIAAVVWTDAILFFLFLVGIGISLFYLHRGIDGGLADAVVQAGEAGKLRLFDFDTDPTRPLTFWAAVFAAGWGQVGPYGCDQLLAQRLFCCKGPKEARKAIVASYAAMVLTLLAALVGVGLWAFYRQQPLEGDALTLVQVDTDRILTVFTLQEVPAGLRGLVLAGVFAAAISSLDSILAALSQTSLSALGRLGEGRRTVWASRVLVIAWGAVLCWAAIEIPELEEEHHKDVLQLALAMAGYTGGALLAGVLLSLLPFRVDGSGFVFSAPLSVLAVFGVAWHAPWAQEATFELGLALLVLWLALRAIPDVVRGGPLVPELIRTLILAGGVQGAWALSRWGAFERAEGPVSLAWPWFVPVGSTVAFVFGLLLARPHRADE